MEPTMQDGQDSQKRKSNKRSCCRYCIMILLVSITAIYVTNFTIIIHTRSRTILRRTMSSIIKQTEIKALSLRNRTEGWVIEMQKQRDIASSSLHLDKHLANILGSLYGREDPDPVKIGPVYVEPPLLAEPEVEDPSFIPKIIHQTYSTEEIPSVYREFIESCLHVNPDWRYMFWSDQGARQFIQDKYPKYLGMYDSYRNKMHKADAMRYFILDYYGGLYMDMDIKCLKPIKEFLAEKHMVLAPEPHVQSLLLYKKFSIVTNAIMAAEPSHPFMKYVIDKLEYFQKHVMQKRKKDIIHVTGPNMLQDVLETYQRDFPRIEDRCKVFVADPADLVPTTDPSRHWAVNKFLRACKMKARDLSVRLHTAKGNLSDQIAHTVDWSKYMFKSNDEYQTCAWVVRTGWDGKVTPRAYTDHLWKHLGYRAHFYGRKVSIGKVVGRKMERYRSPG